MDEDYPRIKVGDYIVIQRQKYIKLHKFSSPDSTAALGNEQLELRNIEGERYFSTFKMIPQEGKKGGHGGKKRLSSLELCTDIEMRNIRELLNIQECGEDNRNITADLDAQTLKADDIHKLKDECSGSVEILEKIVENSKSFSSKTEYSQDKYLKKKEKKYFEFIQIRQPSIRLLTEIYYRLDPEKIMGIRFDTLSQIISYSDISAFGNFLLFESGSNGLLPATFLNSMGSGTEAQLVHMHPGNVCQKQGVLAMNFPLEQLNRCISVNIYSVLREYYQGNEDDKVKESVESENGSSLMETDDKDNQNTSNKEISQDIVLETENEPPVKKMKTEDENIQHETSNKEETNGNDGAMDVSVNKIPQWQIENEKACKLFKEKFDSLTIACKEHPTNIVKELLPLIKPSRPVVIFHSCKEVLVELYVDLKADGRVTGLHLTSTFLRMLQILPNRTHPEVNMNGNSGYLLHGYTVKVDK